MASMNRVHLLGNLTRDPEIKELPSGTPVSDFGLAINETFKNGDGEKVEKVCYVDVTVWDKQAKVCEKYLKKGMPVLIEGRLQLDQWKTGDGDRRSKLKVRADRVHLLPRGGNGKNPE